MEIGKGYYLETVGHYYAGTCCGFEAGFILLKNAVQIGEAGDLSITLKTAQWPNSDKISGIKRVNLGFVINVDECPPYDHKEN